MGRRTFLVMLLVILAAGITRAELAREGIVLRSPPLPIGPDLTVLISKNLTTCHLVNITSVVVPPPPHANMTVALSLSLQPGSFSPSGSVTVVYRISDNFTIPTLESRLSLLASGGSNMTTVSMIVSASIAHPTHEITVEVDPENYFPERNEANNGDSLLIDCY